MTCSLKYFTTVTKENCNEPQTIRHSHGLTCLERACFLTELPTGWLIYRSILFVRFLATGSIGLKCDWCSLLATITKFLFSERSPTFLRYSTMVQPASKTKELQWNTDLPCSCCCSSFCWFLKMDIYLHVFSHILQTSTNLKKNNQQNFYISHRYIPPMVSMTMSPQIWRMEDCGIDLWSLCWYWM
jgi:hypothetical protein